MSVLGRQRLVLYFIFLLSSLVYFVNGQIDPVVIKGSRFFHGDNGSQFFMRAVYVHDSGRSFVNSTAILDVLAEGELCQRDIPYFQKLNINTIAIDGIDLTKDHASCMVQLAKAGIFVLVYLNGRSSASYRSGGHYFVDWDYLQFERIQGIIDEYQKYPNTLGFVYIIPNPNTGSIPFQMSIITSMKKYMKEKNYRKLPIGLATSEGSAADQTTDGPSPVANFINCGDKETSVDFFALTTSSDCLTKSSLAQSRLIERYSNYSIPLFLSYGCTTAEPRDFKEIEDIFGEKGSKVFSGVAIKNWFEDWTGGHDHGLVDTRDSVVIPRPGYYALASQLELIKPSSVMMQQYVPSTTPAPTCAPLIIKIGRSTGTNETTSMVLEPNIPVQPSRTLCSCMMKSLHCTVRNGTSASQSRDKVAQLCSGESNLANCVGISVQPNKGKFGSFVGCAIEEKASWQLNQNFVNGTWNSTDCSSFGGTIQTPLQTAKNGDCAILLQQAGPEGTGLVTYTPLFSTNSADRGETRGSSLTKSQIIGICLGALCAVLLAIGLLFFLRHRKKRNAETEEFEKAELPDSAVERQAKIATSPIPAYSGIELEAIEKTELPADIPSELGGKEKHELDGTEKIEVDADEAMKIYELSGSPIDRDRKFSFDNQVDTIIKY